MMGEGEGEGEEEQRIVWNLKVGVRVRRFSLKLLLLHNHQRISSLKLHRLSFLLRFRNHHLKIDSHSKPDPIHKPNSRCRFRFLRSLLFFRRRKRRQVEPQGVSENKLVWNWNRSLKKPIKCGLCNYRGGVGVAIFIIIIIIITNFHLRSTYS
uniref:Transmembrane protein n=1 Tax=Noccaea caerulescens TaxID=107243 RepID=A0A1J3GPE7_NOCCA